MDTRELLKADFAALEKRGKKRKDKELTPEEKQLIADKEAAREIVAKCCKQCANADVRTGPRESDNMCNECYAVYNEKTKRFWLARYKRK